MKNFLVFFIMIVLFSYGCAPTETIPEKTQLQIRELQTRTYQTDDVKMVLKAMLNVLQDDGYIVKNTNTDLGFLSATKEIDIENRGEALLSTFLLGNQASWKKNALIEATANVSSFNKECRVRVNFQVKVMDNKGGVREVKPIDDVKHYEDFFSKVDKGIFIQKENL